MLAFATSSAATGVFGEVDDARMRFSFGGLGMPRLNEMRMAWTWTAKSEEIEEER